MPDMSCRKCGGTLRKFSLCVECRRPIQHLCTECGILTSPTFHNECFYFMSNVQTRMNRMGSNDLLTYDLLMPKKSNLKYLTIIKKSIDRLQSR
jgi:hypothetical protein